MSYYTITEADVGQHAICCFGKFWPVEEFLGRVLPHDVGKRVYLRGEIVQVENNEQRDRRQDRPKCECANSGRPKTEVSGPHHPNGGPDCGQPAVMHLFQVGMVAPINFCELCGDAALESGLFVTGEEIVGRTRFAEWGR